VVAFVAGVLERLLRSRLEWKLECPGTRPRRRVLNGGAISNRRWSGAPESFDDMQTPGRTVKPDFFIDVRRVHNQGVTVPPTNRIAEPPLQVRADVRTADADDAGIVDLLGENHDVRRRLDDSVEVAVEEIWNDGRSDCLPTVQTD
jgi:hypothetical protein